MLITLVESSITNSYYIKPALLFPSRVEPLLMLFCEPFKPFGDLGVLVNHVYGFVRIFFHVEERKPYLSTLVSARHTVFPGPFQSTVSVRKMKFPLSVSGYYPL